MVKSSISNFAAPKLVKYSWSSRNQLRCHNCKKTDLNQFRVLNCRSSFAILRIITQRQSSQRQDVTGHESLEDGGPDGGGVVTPWRLGLRHVSNIIMIGQWAAPMPAAAGVNSESSSPGPNNPRPWRLSLKMSTAWRRRDCDGHN